MKIFKLVILAMLMTISTQATTFAAPIPLRGVIEGFYGTPWTFEQREDLMIFCRRHNLNAYIYAPKDDLYHRDKWREPYPAEKFSELKTLVSAAKSNGVRFIFAVSPGQDLNYKGKKGDADFNFMMQKLEAMYQVGVRDFAIFFDDLKDDKGNHHEDGKLQAEFINKVQNELRKNHKDIGQILTVPTEYFRLDMVNGRGKIKSYTKDFAENLDKKVVVLFTGDGVVCDGISEETLAEVNEIFGRQVGIWWNYPVNDYTLTDGGNRSAKLALGAIEKLPAENVQAIFFNPMNQPLLSRIALATGADYANNPANYDAEKSWDKAIQEQFGELAPAMKIFAEHSQHMENSWAKVGANDGRTFNTLAYLVLNATKNGRTADFSSLEKEIGAMENATNILLEKLPANILSECKLQLQQFGRIIQADKIAVKSLREKKLDSKLKTLREEISKYEGEAILSEQSALKFVDDTINFFESRKTN